MKQTEIGQSLGRLYYRNIYYPYIFYSEDEYYSCCVYSGKNKSTQHEVSSNKPDQKSILISLITQKVDFEEKFCQQKDCHRSFLRSSSSLTSDAPKRITWKNSTATHSFTFNILPKSLLEMEVYFDLSNVPSKILLTGDNFHCLDIVSAFIRSTNTKNQFILNNIR